MKKQSRSPVLLEKMRFKLCISVRNNKIVVVLWYFRFVFFFFFPSSAMFSIFSNDLEAMFLMSKGHKMRNG